MSKSIKFPKWFTILTIVLIISNLLVFGLFTLLHPELAWPDLGLGEAKFPIQFFAARHMAFGVILLHGLIKKKPEVLAACYHMFLIISVLDVALLATNDYYIPLLVRVVGETSSLVSAALATVMFIIPMALSIKHLRSYK
ncbi:MAG: hypothetical protein ACPGTP_02445 [Bacteroidia bacterium]